MNPGDRARRVALVTGAAGGLGRALVEGLRAAAWRVAAGTHRTAATGLPDGVMRVGLDVTDTVQVDAAVREVLDRWGRIDLLVNNAGLTRDHLITRLAPTDWDGVIAVNLTGAFRCARAVLPGMVARGEGGILNIGSFAGRVGAQGQAAYAAAKAGLLGLTATLAREAGPSNVRVNSVLPGVLRTAMTRELSPTQLDRFAAENVLGRLNDLDEVVRCIVFLAGTRNISGQLFQLDSRIGAWS